MKQFHKKIIGYKNVDGLDLEKFKICQFVQHMLCKFRGYNKVDKY